MIAPTLRDCLLRFLEEHDPPRRHMRFEYDGGGIYQIDGYIVLDDLVGAIEAWAIAKTVPPAEEEDPYRPISVASETMIERLTKFYRPAPDPDDIPF